MHITFTPDFKSKTRISTAAVAEDPDTEQVQVVFTAKIGEEDYKEVVRSGARLEVWTNAPTPHNGSRAGEWGAVQFSLDTPATESEENTAQSLHLVNPDAGSTSAGSPLTSSSTSVTTYVFQAKTTLPRAPPKRYYGFTYRIVYPSGVFWLGTPATNGIIEVTPGASDDKACFFEEEGCMWTSLTDTRGLVRIAKDDGNVACDKIVGRLDLENYSWTGWAIEGAT